MIKRYPGGRFSSLLGNEIDSQTQLRFTGPYGAFHLRRSERPILMVAGGSGMAPVLAVLRQLAHEGCERPVRFFYGAREERDLFALEEIAALGERLADFRFTPVTGRFVHEAIDSGARAEPDVYMCGPPPMLEAVEAMLAERGVDPAPDLPGQVHDLGRRRGRGRPRPAAGPSPRAGPPRALPPSATSPGTRPRAPGDDLRGRHDRHPALDPPPPARGAGRSASRTAAGPGTTPRPRCAAATGSPSATPASSGSGPSTRRAPRSSTRSRAPSARRPSRD